MDMVKSNKLVFTYTQQTETEEVKKFDALKGIDLTISEGEFVAILGHNGSGKSTLAKHMNALLTPTSGTILIRGYDTLVESNVWEVRKTAGMVFQNPDNQIIATIVEEDVAFGPENLGIEPKEIKRRVHDSLESVGMLEHRKSAPHYLSGGQKQRIAIAGVLAMKPACIVLDEPTAMLDPSGRREVIQTVTRLNREEGITIILITHYMEEAVQADRVIVMEDGEIVMNDVPKKVFSRVEELKSYGLDVPQVTEVAWLLRKQGFPVGEDILTIEEMVDAVCQLK